jgi:hypothetical protein
MSADGEILRSSKRELSEAEARAIRDVVLASEEGIDLASLNITPETLKTHTDVIKRAALPRENPAGITFPSELDDLLEWKNIARIVNERLATPLRSTTRFQFRVVFEGEDPVVVESSSELPGMLPWSVTAHGKTWRTWSLPVSVALQRVLAADVPDHHSLHMAEAYWNAGFWADESMWREIGDRVEETAAQSIYEQLNGYEAARKEWSISRPTIGAINSGPFGLHLMLSRRSSVFSASAEHIINGAWWWVPIKDQQPRATWNDLQGAVERATASLHHHTWLDAWKRSTSGREVELHVVGDDPSGDRPVEATVLPAWRAAGLAGRPEFDVLLRDGGRMGEVFFGSEDSRAIVVWMSETSDESKHWLDKEVFHYQSGGGCLIVDSSGQHERCR